MSRHNREVFPRAMRVFRGSLFIVCLSAAPVVCAQTLPAGPAELAGGQVTIAGDVTAAFGAPDDIAFFNYTDYDHNALRQVQASVSAAWRPSSRVAVLGQLRMENTDHPVPFALYVRVRPWKDRAFDIQAGRIPTVFGAFARRSYATSDNPLIGYPLAYQYLTNLRADAIPATADDLLLMRGRGWLASYPVGSTTPDAGVPLISAYRWDTGVEAHGVWRAVDAAVAVTRGTLAQPRVEDNNGGNQVSARVGVTPVPGLILGVSASRGAFLDSALQDRYGSGGNPFTQRALGVDAEYSIQYWLVRGEWVQSRWTLPAIAAPFITDPLTANAGYVEARYKFTPRLFGAARVDALTFSDIRGQRIFGGLPASWDASVQRIEAGGGVYLQRNLTVRAVVQRNWRDGGRVRRKTYVSAQVSYWF